MAAPFDFKTLGKNSSKPGDEFNSAIDFGQLIGPLAEQQYGSYAPLQGNVIDLLTKLLSGDTSGIDKMFAPTGAKIRSQLGHAQRNIQDTVPTAQLGNAMSQLGSNAITTEADAYNQFLMPFFQQATALGSNALSSQVLPWLAAGGQITKKPASGGGGMS